jgi:DNA-binding NtrC family response regulator
MNRRKILFVDDDAAIRNAMGKVFNRGGYNVILAENAEQALEIIKHENINVMFLDLNLPGMNGVDLCRYIQKEKPDAIIYAVTGYFSLYEISECIDAGFKDYFEKPADLKLLIKAADDAFQKLEIEAQTGAPKFYDI